MKPIHLDEKWTVTARRADFMAIAREFGIDPVVARLIVNRGPRTSEEISQYLGRSSAEAADPSLMKDLEKAATIIEEMISAGRLIVVASDYDVDGIFSGQLLYDAITMLGGKAQIMTPHRVKEGYGLNSRIVGDAAAAGAGMILTCDNGVSAFDAVSEAKAAGLKVVITDHHEIPYENAPSSEGGAETARVYRLPPADAVVDPHQEDCAYPYKGLCGTGVALRLVQKLFTDMSGGTLPDTFYEYAAIATIADVMELTGENRSIVRRGLSTLGRTKNIGLRALIDECGLSGKKMMVHHVGFVLGPCFNASGRLESTEKAQRLLMTSDVAEAQELAKGLRELNASRKEMTERGREKAIEKIDGSGLADDDIILVDLEDCHESIAGIVAGRLRERYGKPAFVFTRTEECYKGSGRSMEGYHMYEGLSECADLIRVFGGHAMAAGLSVDFDRLAELRTALNANFETLKARTELDMRPAVHIDVPMPTSYITEELVKQLELLEPYGNGNAKPLFAENSFKIISAQIVGKNKNVLLLYVENSSGHRADAVLFNEIDTFVHEAKRVYGDEEWEKALRHEANAIDVALAYFPAINEYMGVRSIQLQVSHYKFN